MHEQCGRHYKEEPIQYNNMVISNHSNNNSDSICKENIEEEGSLNIKGNIDAIRIKITRKPREATQGAYINNMYIIAQNKKNELIKINYRVYFNSFSYNVCECKDIFKKLENKFYKIEKLEDEENLIYKIEVIDKDN